MIPIPIDIPAGISSNGTPYYRRGNWIDGSRIRWQEGVIQPIGGWGRFSTNLGELDRVVLDPVTEVARATLGYKLNDGSGMYVAATNLGLKAWYRGNTTVYDITPTDFVSREVDTVEETGYGMWFYGLDAYGTERQGDDLDSPDVFAWTLRTWGQNLLAAPRGAPSKLYEWAPTFGTPAAALSNAPVDFDCFHVTDERIVMCAGSPAAPRLVQWSTRENNNEWAPTTENQAGSYTLPGIGRIKAIVNVQDRYLMVSEADAYLCEYLGPPYVYGFEQAGDNCGTVAGMSVVSIGRAAMWLGESSFYVYEGGTISPMECPVMDKFKESVNRSQVTKTVGFANPIWPEIWWLYQSGGDDIDSYIYYNWMTKHWGIGKLDRTCASGNAATGGLYMIGADGYAYNHELEGVAPIDNDMSEVYVESGPIEVQKFTTAYVTGIVPDYVSAGQVRITLKGQTAPTAKSLSFGPYLVEYPLPDDKFIPARARGQLITLRVEGVSELWTQGSISLLLADMGGAR